MDLLLKIESNDDNLMDPRFYTEQILNISKLNYFCFAILFFLRSLPTHVEKLSVIILRLNCFPADNNAGGNNNFAHLSRDTTFHLESMVRFLSRAFPGVVHRKKTDCN